MIGGIQPCSFIDFPGHLAAVVFFQGCNLSCPYCHNLNLISSRGGSPLASCLEFLNNRRGLLTGVVLSGGEPTLDPGLVNFIREIKRLGFFVKLDTNGMLPSVVDALVSEGVLDYVAVDIKLAPDSQYSENLGSGFQGYLPIECLSKVASRVECEARTTVVDNWHSEIELLAILDSLVTTGVKKWFLQRYRGDRFSSTLDLSGVVCKARGTGMSCDER